ncbi:MAG: hypothetical protein V4556_03665 [Bacteroidota bacterium]
MKVQLTSFCKVLVKRILPVIIIAFLMIVPGVMFGQNPGDNPDARPPEVPLDPRMTVILIIMGILLAVRVMRKIAMLKPQPVSIK